MKRKIGAMVAGWLMALMVAMVRGIVKRALAKQGVPRQAAARQHPPQPQPSPRKAEAPKPQPFKKWAITDTIFQGMNQSELVAAYGEPTGKVSGGAGREVWTYAAKHTSNDNGQPGMTVTLESGIVTDWTEVAA